VLPDADPPFLLQVAVAIAGIESKVLRADLAAVGVASRDRITSRSGHPLRALVDRLARVFGVDEIELAISSTVERTRVLSHDVPWIVVPKSLTERPVAYQAASLARGIARVACGIPWLGELSPSHIGALLVATARQVVPSYGDGSNVAADAKLVARYEPSIARALSRRQRKLLEELAAQKIAPTIQPPNCEEFVGTLVRAELRTAYLAVANLLAMVDQVAEFDSALRSVREAPESTPAVVLAAIARHPFTGDLTRFALSREAISIRQRLGSFWPE
jgi:hypothetical protein